MGLTMAYSLTIGSIRCHILSDGKSLSDGGGFFGLIPRSMWQEVIAPDAQNLIPWESRALLVESDAGLILVDTGNGDKLTPKARQRLGMDDRNLRLVATWPAPATGRRMWTSSSSPTSTATTSAAARAGRAATGSRGR